MSQTSRRHHRKPAVVALSRRRDLLTAVAAAAVVLIQTALCPSVAAAVVVESTSQRVLHHPPSYLIDHRQTVHPMLLADSTRQKVLPSVVEVSAAADSDSAARRTVRRCLMSCYCSDQRDHQSKPAAGRPELRVHRTRIHQALEPHRKDLRWMAVAAEVGRTSRRLSLVDHCFAAAETRCQRRTLAVRLPSLWMRPVGRMRRPSVDQMTGDDR